MASKTQESQTFMDAGASRLPPSYAIGKTFQTVDVLGLRL